MICGLCAPDTLKVVESPNLWPEQVDDNVACINQNPIGIWQAFDARASVPVLLDAAGYMLSQCSNMPLGTPRSYDHLVCNGGFALKINHQQFFCFVIFEGFDHGGGDMLDDFFRRCGGRVG